MPLQMADALLELSEKLRFLPKKQAFQRNHLHWTIVQGVDFPYLDEGFTRNDHYTQTKKDLYEHQNI